MASFPYWADTTSKAAKEQDGLAGRFTIRDLRLTMAFSPNSETGMRERARPAGGHPGVAPVALALVARNGVEFARVGDQDLRAQFGEVTADPRAVRAGLHRHRGAGELGQQLRQGGPGVGQRALADNLAGGIEDANVMRAVTEIQAEGEPAGRNRGGRRWRGDDGRSLGLGFVGFSYV